MAEYSSALSSDDRVEEYAPAAGSAAPDCGRLDWDDLRFFLAIARRGSLSAAAQDLRVMQSTVGRRLAALETALRVRLLTRTRQGYVATPAGESILESVERREAEALSVMRIVGGQDTRLDGTVRVACVSPIASHILAPCFARLHQQHPEITIELRPVSRHFGLSLRDVDIAVSSVRPEQHEVVVRRVCNLAFGLYASPSYLERHGMPDFEAGCRGQRIILPPDDTEFQEQARWFGEIARSARVVSKSSCHETQLNSAVCGDGVACLPRFYAHHDSRLKDLSVTAPSAEVWLAVHRDNKRTRRIKVVLQCVADGVRDHVRRLGAETGGGRAAERDAVSTRDDLSILA